VHICINVDALPLGFCPFPFAHPRVNFDTRIFSDRPKHLLDTLRLGSSLFIPVRIGPEASSALSLGLTVSHLGCPFDYGIGLAMKELSEATTRIPIKAGLH